MNMTEEELQKILEKGQVKVRGSEVRSPSSLQTSKELQTEYLNFLAVQLKKEGAQQPHKQNKYRNEKTSSSGIKFDSKKEAKRYEELCLLLAAGAITDLKLQETFILQRAFTTVEGNRIRAITYTPDFTYKSPSWKITTIEDVKGRRTEKFNVVWKMMKEQYPQYSYLLT